jgi:uncharacterized membrane protein
MAMRILWIMVIILAIFTGVFPFLFYLLHIEFGIIALKDKTVLDNLFWKIGFHTHIIFAAIALLIGWLQFGATFRSKYITLHKAIGKVYIISALTSSVAGFCISFFATGGFVSFLGFILLDTIWLYTTLMAYVSIKYKRIEGHKKMMIYSYAACLAGVTLRLWLPFLVKIIGNYYTAYSIVAWLSWVPNLIVASIIINRSSR